MGALSNQFKRLNAQRGEFCQQVFGATDETGKPVEMTYDGQPFIGYFSPVRSVRQLMDCGFALSHDVIVRASRETFPAGVVPLVDKVITIPITGADEPLRVRVREIPPLHPQSAEYVLGCGERYAPETPGLTTSF